MTDPILSGKNYHRYYIRFNPLLIGYPDVVQISVMRDALSLSQIGLLKNPTMARVAPLVIIVAQRMIIVFVLIVSILEQLLKVWISRIDEFYDLIVFSAWLGIQKRNVFSWSN